MERLQIRHSTEYHFQSLVSFNTHRLLLRPREGHDVRIESSRLEISPRHSIRWHRDAFGNCLALVNLHQAANQLKIVSHVIIQHYEDSPIDFSSEDCVLDSPFVYDDSVRMDLQNFQTPIFTEDQPTVMRWLYDLGFLHQSFHAETLNSRLNQAIHGQFRYEAREEAGVQSPATTLYRGVGSCRDYATLFIEACRSLGLASRFVSGYLHAPATEAGHASTHAWAEVYLPGLGWQGFDPTVGEVTHNRHIAVAVARNPESVPPVSGSFIGSTLLRPKMWVDVQVNRLSDS